MSEVSSKTTLLVGPYTIVSEDDDVAVMGALQLADGWTITQQLGDDQLWPQQPTETASFTVYAGDADDIAGIVEGARVDIAYRTPRTSGGIPKLRFLGRVTDSVVRAHAVGVVVDVTAVDYRHAELGELLIGDTPWPQEGAIERMTRIMGLLGVTYSHNQLGAPASHGTYPGSDPLVKARDVDSQSALSIIDRLLDSWAVDYTATQLPFGVVTDNGLCRHWLVPTIDPVTGLVTEWETSPVSAQLDSSAALPGLFGDTTAEGAPGYGVLIPTDAVNRAEGVVSAVYVDLSGAAFSQRRGKRPNAVAVKWVSGGAEATMGASNGLTPVSVWRLETELVQSAAAALAAQLYLPDAAGTDWYADAFSWRWYADVWAQTRVLPAIGDQVTIAPVQARHSPTGRPWYTGILTQLVWKMSAAQPVVDITVRPQIRPQLSGQPATGKTWDTLPAGVTWDQLNTRDTWDDYALLRS